MEKQSTIFEEHIDAGYRGRTLRNASADVTFAFAADFSTAGEKLTKRSILEQERIYCPIAYRGHFATENAIHAAVAALNRSGKPEVTLNIAGNGMYTLRHFGDQATVDAYALDFLRRVLASPSLATSITLVRSGGQTGFDEAGVKAAHQLGLSTLVLAPKGWKFRLANGQDISDEHAFKQRFEEPPTHEYPPKETPMSIDASAESRAKNEDRRNEANQTLRGLVEEAERDPAMLVALQPSLERIGQLLKLGGQREHSSDMGLSSIEQMRKGRQKVADLGKVLDSEWGEAVQGIPGYLYEHNLYIEIDGRGQGVLTIANTSFKDVSLNALEERLHEWAVAEGYEFHGRHLVANREGDANVAVASKASEAHIATPMERMLAEALRAILDGGGFYDDGDFYVEATDGERAAGEIKMIRTAFDAVRVYDEAVGRFGADRLNPVIPDVSARIYTYEEVLHCYRELLKANPGKGLMIHREMVAVYDPESDTLLRGDHLGGPDVLDVTDLTAFPAINSTFTPGDMVIREIEAPAFVDLPEGFEKTLRDAVERQASTEAANDGPEI